MKDVTAGLAVAFAGLALIEGLLRIVGFEFDTVPHRVELMGEAALEDQKSHGEVTERHPALLWSLVPGAKLGDLTINEAGFVGAMPTLEPQKGVYRIVCLGDSNVALGLLPYPQELQKLLDAKAPGRFEVINAGVPGYTLLQGLRLLEGRVVSYSPDLVTVQYGWNDHWMNDKPMSQKISRGPVAFGFRNTLRALRIYQVLLYAYAHWLKAPKGDSVHYNVPPEEYREYLSRIVELGTSHGFEVALLTVPGNFKLENLPPFVRVGFRPDHPDPRGRPEGLLRIHSELNDLVRQASKHDGVTLVDLEERFSHLQGRDDYFLSDAIHTNQRGRQFIAQTLADEVLERTASAGHQSAGTAKLGVGRYPVSDARVMLKDFAPMVPSAQDSDIFQSALRSESQVMIVGVRAVSFRVNLVFAPVTETKSVLVSGQSGESPESVSVASDGRASLSTPRSPDANGVLVLRVTEPGSAHGDAGAGHGLALRAVELDE